MNKVIAFGEALIDMLSSRIDAGNPVDHAESESERFTKYPGGAPANVAAAVGKLGGRSYFAGKVGADMFGDFLKQSLETTHVHTDYLLQTNAAKTALAFVSLDTAGERSFAFYRDATADLLFEPHEFQGAWFEDPGIFHFCSNTLTEPGILKATQAGIEKARAAGFVISFDMNLRLDLWSETSDPYAAIWPFVKQADIVKLSTEELAFLCNQRGGQRQDGHSEDEASVLQTIKANGAALIIVTDGERALQYHTPLCKSAIQPPDVTMVDSTAAGDAFVGGLLYQLSELDLSVDGLGQLTSNIDQLEEILVFASACGAHAATRKGAFDSLPDQQSLQTFLQHPSLP